MAHDPEPERHRLFRYQLYEAISLEEVEPLGSTALGEKGDGQGNTIGSYGIEHFGMKAEVLKVYGHVNKGIVSLDSRVKSAKINKYFIGYAATGSYFCELKPRVHFVKVDVKCLRTPPKTATLKIRKTPEYWTMTYSFDVHTQAHIAPALRVIKIALEDSL